MQSKPVVLGLFLFASLLATLAVVIIVFGKDDNNIQQFLNFIVVVVPMTVGMLFLGKQANDVQNDVTAIKEQVNGKLDKKFSAVHDKLDDMSATAADATMATALPVEPDPSVFQNVEPVGGAAKSIFINDPLPSFDTENPNIVKGSE